jgi:CheY-like chemotaxis protein
VSGKARVSHLSIPGRLALLVLALALPLNLVIIDGELVLVVEDNDAVREATASRLQSLGYDVLEARTGTEAIKFLEVGTPADLIFADIVMPGGMTKWVPSRRPNLKVLLTSGYANLSAAVNGFVREIKVLGNPYTREQLAKAVHETLRGCLEGDASGVSEADACIQIINRDTGTSSASSSMRCDHSSTAPITSR